ncbi:MAG: hypothetical protein ACYDBY_06670 [Thermoanaerobaculia bacterium]
MKRLLRSAILVAVAVLPLALQASAAVDLLDSGRVRHAPSIVELLVHGHAHGRTVAAHVHAAPHGPGRVTDVAAPALLPAFGSDEGASVLARQGSQGPPAADEALASSPPRHLLHVSLLR